MLMKSKRHAKILELISRLAIDTQEELQKNLRLEGFNVTQATVSRDIKELRLTKTLDSDGRYKYTAGAKNTTDAKESFISLFSTSVLSVDYAQNIVVIKTHSAVAQAVCASLDKLNNDAILGTIAGDDTIFCVCRNNQLSIKLVSELRKMLL